MRRALVKVLASAAPAAAATLLVHDASANPPPPKVLPDPPISAPSADEAPTMVRRHQGLCFAFFPSGGAFAIACPNELKNEALGQAILKNPSGRCQWIPLQSGGPGRNGLMDACPPIFAQVAKANVIPESSKRLMAAANAGGDESEPWTEPQPARLEITPPQQVGCSVGAPHAGAGAGGVALAALSLGVVRRRRSRRR